MVILIINFLLTYFSVLAIQRARDAFKRKKMHNFLTFKNLHVFVFVMKFEICLQHVSKQVKYKT